MCKTNKMAAVLMGLIMPAALVACAPPFPREMLDKVERDIAFKDLRKEPERFRGSWVMLAGIIIETRNTAEGTTIKVLQKPRDRAGRPLQTDLSGGRFIILSAEFLDPVVFHPGRMITVVGEAAGQRAQPLDEIEYLYPLVRAASLRLWDPHPAGPRFHFGIGIMHIR